VNAREQVRPVLILLVLLILVILAVGVACSVVAW
jgi:hypothetical protein